MAKSKKKVKEEAPVPDDFHIVIYTDGGCQPNPGFAGYGVHGYSYRETGVNINRFRLTKRATTKGYGQDTVPENERTFALDVLSASGVVEFGNRTTNNVAELTALTTGLNLAMQYMPEDGKGKLLSIHVLSDSEYTLKVLDIIIKARDKSKRAEMLRKPLSNGQPRKNVPQTLKLLAAVEGCEAAGITSITHKWIKGHDGLAGNEEADALATRAVQINMQANSRSAKIFKSRTLEHAKWINARMFWRSKHDALPLIDHNNVVFSNISQEKVSWVNDGVHGLPYVYLLSTEADELRAEKKSPPGANGQADEVDDDADAAESLTGADSETDSDKHYPKVAGRLAHFKASTTRAIVLTPEKLDMVEDVFSLYRTEPMFSHVMGDIILVKVPTLYSDSFAADYALLGLDALVMQDNELDPTIYPFSRASLAYNGKYATLHVKPQKVSMYMLDHFGEMAIWMENYLNGDHDAFAGMEDITDIFYVEEKGKTVLDRKYGSGFNRLELNHATSVYYPGTALDDRIPVDLKLVLLPGIHLPCRNKLKRLEESNPKVTLVSILIGYSADACASYKFFVVIEADCGKGIYAAEISNVVFKDLTKGETK